MIDPQTTAATLRATLLHQRAHPSVALFLLMLTNFSRHADKYSRSFRVRLVTLLVLITQVSSLLIVPLHAIAHGHAAYASATTVAASSGLSAASLFSRLFGHGQGVGCDDWSAAFALDSNSGHSLPDLCAVLASATTISGSLPNAPPATPFRQFLARAPPRL